MSTDTPRERRKKKAQQAMENRSKAVVESVGKSSPANSFVPAHDGDDVPPMPTAQTDIPKLAEIKGQAVVQNQAGLAMPKSPTLSDMLAEQRKTAIKEKTDAVNMQKYHALTDALGALGKMGGAAIGGAIGGNMMDSAPVVGEYQPSRGYIAAFEKAKNANDRLRALDEKEFNLLYNDLKRTEERQDKEQSLARERQWQKEMVDYKTKIDRATAEGNMKLKAELEAEAAARAHEYAMEQIAAKNAGSIAEKEIGKKMSDEQFERYNTELIAFKDGTSVSLPKNYYNAVANFFIDDDYITEKNVARYMRDNPTLVRKVLEQLGHTPSSSAPNTQKQTSMMPNGFYGGLWNPQQSAGNYVEMTPEQAKQTTGSKSKKQTTEIPDIYQFVEKK